MTVNVSRDYSKHICLLRLVDFFASRCRVHKFTLLIIIIIILLLLFILLNSI